MNIIYLSIGNNPIHHARAYFSIVTFLKYNTKHPIFVYTDAPQFYKGLEAVVSVKELTPERVKDWCGNYGVWRAKIKSMEDLALKSSEPVVLVDTDTFWYKNFDTIVEDVNNGFAYLHLDEGKLKNMKHTPYRMWKGVKGKTFAGITIDESMNMWNSGFVAIPVDKQQECFKLALSLCDEIVASGVKYYLVEQYSFSIALNHIYKVKPASDFLGHYWGNKPEWDDYIKTFLADQHLKGNSIEQSVKDINDADLYKIPVFKHVSSRKPALDRLLNKLLVKKKIWINK
jgi:hypothetical protein